MEFMELSEEEEEEGERGKIEEEGGRGEGEGEEKLVDSQNKTRTNDGRRSKHTPVSKCDQTTTNQENDELKRRKGAMISEQDEADNKKDKQERIKKIKKEKKTKTHKKHITSVATDKEKQVGHANSEESKTRLGDKEEPPIRKVVRKVEQTTPLIPYTDNKIQHITKGKMGTVTEATGKDKESHTEIQINKGNTATNRSRQTRQPNRLHAFHVICDNQQLQNMDEIIRNITWNEKHTNWVICHSIQDFDMTDGSIILKETDYFLSSAFDIEGTAGDQYVWIMESTDPEYIVSAVRKVVSNFSMMPKTSVNLHESGHMFYDEIVKSKGVTPATIVYHSLLCPSFSSKHDNRSITLPDNSYILSVNIYGKALLKNYMDVKSNDANEESVYSFSNKYGDKPIRMNSSSAISGNNQLVNLNYNKYGELPINHQPVSISATPHYGKRTAATIISKEREMEDTELLDTIKSLASKVKQFDIHTDGTSTNMTSKTDKMQINAVKITNSFLDYLLLLPSTVSPMELHELVINKGVLSVISLPNIKLDGVSSGSHKQTTTLPKYKWRNACRVKYNTTVGEFNWLITLGQHIAACQRKTNRQMDIVESQMSSPESRSNNDNEYPAFGMEIQCTESDQLMILMVDHWNDTIEWCRYLLSNEHRFRAVRLVMYMVPSLSDELATNKRDGINSLVAADRTIMDLGHVSMMAIYLSTAVFNIDTFIDVVNRSYELGASKNQHFAYLFQLLRSVDPANGSIIESILEGDQPITKLKTEFDCLVTKWPLIKTQIATNKLTADELLPLTVDLMESNTKINKLISTFVSYVFSIKEAFPDKIVGHCPCVTKHWPVVPAYISKQATLVTDEQAKVKEHLLIMLPVLLANSVPAPLHVLLNGLTQRVFSMT